MVSPMYRLPVFYCSRSQFFKRIILVAIVKLSPLPYRYQYRVFVDICPGILVYFNMGALTSCFSLHNAAISSHLQYVKKYYYV